ncbi:MAG: ABC transporter ATP-binding protein [Ancrocorticia sp.]|uniref:ABC transporter ATP-binding protein n=2 Tax=Ancrocorticia sp. TaxID=2593684 RepID=UPI003F9382AC
MTEIVAKNLKANVGQRVIFEQVSLSIPDRSIVALVGPSGSGKTTLLNCLGLLRTPDQGTIEFDGHQAVERWSDRSRREFWRDKAAFIYQDYGLIEDETVAYNVTLRTPSIFGRRRSDSKLEQTLETVGLSGRENERAVVLSGGEKQRVGIARALYKGATCIFADEPTASLDAKNRQLITDLLRRSAMDGASVVIATHDERLASEADAAYTLGQ